MLLSNRGEKSIRSVGRQLANAYTAQDVNALVFVTKGQSSQTLDTLNWCYLQVDRYADPLNASMC